MRNLKPKGTLRPLNKPWLEVDAGDKGDKAKIFKSKSSCSPSKFNPNYFESIKLRVDIPEQFCLVPKLSFTAIDSMMMREYNIGAASVSLLGFLPWMTPQQREQIQAGQFDALAQNSSPLPVTVEPKKYNQDPPHVSVHIANDDDGANDEAKPLLSGQLYYYRAFFAFYQPALQKTNRNLKEKEDLHVSEVTSHQK
jgi:hypothetical protein